MKISLWRIVVYRSALWGESDPSPLEGGVKEGENPVSSHCVSSRGAFHESGCLGMKPTIGGKSLLRLNNGKRPIANKYREGKMKRTLKRELKSA